MRRQDLVVAALALAACAVALFLTFRFTTTTPAAMMQGMGAEFFPRLVIALMAVLAICIGLGIGNPPSEAPPRIPGIVYVTAGVLAAYVVAVELLGMWVPSLVLMIGLGRMWGEKRYARMALASAGMLLVIWVLFVKVLKSGFPPGLVERLWS
jgi:hypothetical protein